eukprot:1107176-Rhodomonas_salina.4
MQEHANDQRSFILEAENSTSQRRQRERKSGRAGVRRGRAGIGRRRGGVRETHCSSEPTYLIKTNDSSVFRTCSSGAVAMGWTLARGPGIRDRIQLYVERKPQCQ